jgi:hypothetical protein
MSWGPDGVLHNFAGLALVDNVSNPPHPDPSAQSALHVDIPPSGQRSQHNALMQGDDFAMNIDIASVVGSSSDTGASVSEGDGSARGIDALKFAVGTHPDIITMCTSIWVKSISTLEEERIHILLKLLRDFEDQRTLQHPTEPPDVEYDVRSPHIRR